MRLRLLLRSQDSSYTKFRINTYYDYAVASHYRQEQGRESAGSTAQSHTRAALEAYRIPICPVSKYPRAAPDDSRRDIQPANH